MLLAVINHIVKGERFEPVIFKNDEAIYSKDE